MVTIDDTEDDRIQRQSNFRVIKRSKHGIYLIYSFHPLWSSHYPLTIMRAVVQFERIQQVYSSSFATLDLVCNRQLKHCVRKKAIQKQHKPRITKMGRTQRKWGEDISVFSLSLRENASGSKSKAQNALYLEIFKTSALIYFTVNLPLFAWQNKKDVAWVDLLTGAYRHLSESMISVLKQEMCAPSHLEQRQVNGWGISHHWDQCSTLES